MRDRRRSCRTCAAVAWIAAKLHFVPNGIVPSMWQGGSREAGRARLGVAADEIAVSYIGTLGMAHGLGTVLDAARLLQGETKVRFVIIGDGAERADLEARATRSGLSNVTFTGLVPRTEIASIMAGADIALVTLKPSETFKTVLPSKMFEAMAAGKPIVLAVEGEAKRVLEARRRRIGRSARKRGGARARDRNACEERRSPVNAGSVWRGLRRSRVQQVGMGRSLSRDPQQSRRIRSPYQVDSPGSRRRSQAGLKHPARHVFHNFSSRRLVLLLSAADAARQERIAKARAAGSPRSPEAARDSGAAHGRRGDCRRIRHRGGAAARVPDGCGARRWISRSFYSCFRPQAWCLPSACSTTSSACGRTQKLLVQVAAAAFAFYNGVEVDGVAGHALPEWLSLVLTVVWLVGCSNAFNLIDGMDGLATGVGLFATFTILVGGAAPRERAARAGDGAAGRSAPGLPALQLQPGVDLSRRLRQFDDRLRARLLRRDLEPEVGDAARHDGAAHGAVDPAARHRRGDHPALHPPPADLRCRPEPRPSPAARSRPEPAPRGADSLRRVRPGGGLLVDLRRRRGMRMNGLLLVVFCVTAWAGIQFVGYAEFDVARSLVMSGTFRDIVHARMFVETVERKIEAASTPDEYWSAMRDVNRELGFAHVRMMLAGKVYEDEREALGRARKLQLDSHSAAGPGIRQLPLCGGLVGPPRGRHHVDRQHPAALRRGEGEESGGRSRSGRASRRGRP